MFQIQICGECNFCTFNQQFFDKSPALRVAAKRYGQLSRTTNFVSGGIILRDEGWNKTHVDYQNIIANYFGGQIPENFEFHTQDLFSPNETGHFLNHPRERRNQLINDLLDIIAPRKHHYYYFAIDKRSLDNYDTTQVWNCKKKEDKQKKPQATYFEC